ncbi:hypothetical protein RB195_025259 [Necator americanus]|uniref:Uncharacterized protein n=1 Tax=Necator americanus TaxID=51031 RepID=A0ABR1ES59_NECAM
MMLFVSHAKRGTTGLLWHAIGTNGRITGASSTSSKINGSQGDQGDSTRASTMGEVLGHIRRRYTGIRATKERRPGLDRRESVERILGYGAEKRRRLLCPLPWREITTTLPDNRAIALRRLDSVWNSFQKDKELLNKYNDTFKEQERHDD